MCTDNFADADRVLVTAGASAPESVVQEAIDWMIRNFDATVEISTVREESVQFPLPKPLRSFAAEVNS